MAKTAALLAVMLAMLPMTACKGRFGKKTGKDAMSRLAEYPGINDGFGTFSFAIPSGWRKYDTSLQGIKFRYVIGPVRAHSMLTPNLNVFTDKISHIGLDAYFEGVRRGAQNARDYAEIGTGRKMIGGHRARWLQYSMTSQKGTHMELIFYAMIADNICYNITMGTATGEMVQYKPSFDTVLNSFTIGPLRPELVRP